MKLGSKHQTVLIYLSLYLLLPFLTYAQATLASPADIILNAKIESKISLEPILADYPLNIECQNGIVRLTGIVSNDKEASTLIELVQSTNGVVDVNIDDLHVKQSQQALTDTAITAKIKGLMLREKLFGSDIPATTVNVATHHGVVYLTGAVESVAQANNAIKITKLVTGVQEVVSRIHIGG